MGWLIALGIAAALAVLPLGVSMIYNGSGPLVRILAGPVKWKVYPRSPKPKKEKKKKETADSRSAEMEKDLPKPPKPPKNQKGKQPAQKGGSLTDFIPLVKLGIRFLGDLRRKLRVDRLELRLVLAGDDPCDLAVNYGRTWAAAGNLLPALDRWFVIKKKNVEVACDFAGDQTLVTARMDLTITLGRLLWLLVAYAIRALKEYLTIQKKRKGGAVT